MTGTDNPEYWYLNYDKGAITKHEQKPKYVCMKKWNGSAEEFLKQKDIKILKVTDKEIKFE